MTLGDFYLRLRSVGDPSVDLAMAAAFPTADTLATRLITLSLLERGRIEVLVALVLHYHRLGADLQEMVARRNGDLDRPLREAAMWQNSHGPANVIRIISRARALRLIYLVTEQFRHGPEPIRREAARCLLELAEFVATCGRPMQGPLYDGCGVEMLQLAIEQLVCVYQHHPEPIVLRAMLPLALSRIAALRVLSSERHPAIPDLRRMLERADAPAVRRAMLVLLPMPALTDVVVRGIAQFRGRNLGEVLETAHLLEISAITKALQKVDGGQLLPSAQQIASFTAFQSRALVRWIMALPLQSGDKVQQLGALCAVADPSTRLAALRQLIWLSDLTVSEDQADTTDPTTLIARFCDDSDPAIARIALRVLIQRIDPVLPILLLRFVNAPHADVRRIAGQALAKLGLARLWQAWPKLSNANRLAAGRALIKLDANFHELLGKKLAHSDIPIRLRALSMVHVFNQGLLFEQALLILATDPNHKITSASVRALGSADSPKVRIALEPALDHPDSRVRANAVEALEQLRGTDHVQRLIEMAQKDDNRPRVNAIKALMQMRTADAMAALSRMFIDPRVKHRSSALWMIETAGVIEVARQVAEMSISDPNRHVKTQAGQVIQHLMQTLGSHPQTPSTVGI